MFMKFKKRTMCMSFHNPVFHAYPVCMQRPRGTDVRRPAGRLGVLCLWFQASRSRASGLIPFQSQDALREQRPHAAKAICDKVYGK